MTTDTNQAAEGAFARAQAQGRAKVVKGGAIRGDALPLTADDKLFADEVSLPIRTRALAAWKSSPRLQAEFPNVESYIAYRKAAERGARGRAG